MKKEKLITELPSFEPKLTNRFITEIEGFPQYVVYETSFPSFYYNIFGFKKYKPLVLKLYDPIEPCSTETVIKQSNKKRNWKIEICHLGPVGDTTASFMIEAKLKSVDFSHGKYQGQNCPSTITLEFNVKSVEFKGISD